MRNMLGPELQSARRSLPWRIGSSLVMGLTGMVARRFLYGLNRVETVGLDQFLGLLDERRDGNHQQGLLTVSNHISVLDDPVMWGILPLKYASDPNNLRWGLGAHDICFRNKFTSKFFSLGQVLPTHRLLHSPHGGLFQPTVAEAIHALSGEEPSPPSKIPGLTFTTNTQDTFPSPSSYSSGQKAWVHIFPEACVHQHPDLSLRYFKWGVSRLVLESNPAPKLVPIFIDGFQDMMHETRKKPRWVPRVGAKVKIIFGDAIDTGRLFARPREQWRRLVDKNVCHAANSYGRYPEALKVEDQAVRLRVQVAAAVRNQVALLRTAAGYGSDDPALAYAANWNRDLFDKRD